MPRRWLQPQNSKQYRIEGPEDIFSMLLRNNTQVQPLRSKVAKVTSVQSDHTKYWAKNADPVRTCHWKCSSHIIQRHFFSSISNKTFVVLHSWTSPNLNLVTMHNNEASNFINEMADYSEAADSWGRSGFHSLNAIFQRLITFSIFK